MEIKKFEGKTYDETLVKALEELKVTEEEILVEVKEIKGKLFKGSSVELYVILFKDIAVEVENYLQNLLDDMGLKTTISTKVRGTQVSVTMDSDNNAILIGKNGQTLEALQNIVKNAIHKKTGVYISLLLDVGDYKSKHEQSIERLAKNVAREVSNTKVEAKLDSMNSYERRIVHNVLTNFKGVKTESEGEEPNRYVVIKPE